MRKRGEVEKKVVKLAVSIFFLSLMSLSFVTADFSSMLTSAKRYFSGEENFITGMASSRTTNVSVTLGNAAPTVEAIVSGGYTIAAQSVTENGITELRANFLVTDPDGTGDLNDTTANLTLIRSSAPWANGNISANTTCYANADVDSDTANYTCVVQMQYWFSAGAWNLTAGIRDNSSAPSSNTTNFTLQETTAIVISPVSITFASITIGQANVTSNNDPIVVNNTANDDITAGNVRATGIDLIGEVNRNFTIGANNFTIDVDTGGSPPQNVQQEQSLSTILQQALPVLCCQQEQKRKSAVRNYTSVSEEFQVE